MLSAIEDFCAADSGRLARLSSSLWRLIDWKIVPSSATPNVPPTMRFIDRIPEATPALVAGTAFIAAGGIRDIPSALPPPHRAKARRRAGEPPRTGDLVCRN